MRCVGNTFPHRSSKRCLLGSGPSAERMGSTEIGTGTVTRSDDPPNWAAFSNGRPINGMELDIRSDAEITDKRQGRLYARGGAVCLATVGRDTGP